MSAPTLEHQIEYQESVCALLRKYGIDSEGADRAILASLRELAEWRRLSEEYHGALQASRDIAAETGWANADAHLRVLGAERALLEYKP